MCWVRCVSYFTAKGCEENCICNKTPTYHVLSVAVLAIPKTWQPPEAFRCSFLFTLRDFAFIREEKEGRQRKWAPHYYSGRGSQSGAGKRVTGYPLSRKLYHSRRGVTNKMALKVVETNKVCESRIARNRPPRDTLPPSTPGSRCQNTAMERGTGLTAGLWSSCSWR